MISNGKGSSNWFPKYSCCFFVLACDVEFTTADAIKECLCYHIHNLQCGKRVPKSCHNPSFIISKDISDGCSCDGFFPLLLAITGGGVKSE